MLHAGPVGTGAVLKLAVNLPLMIYWQALGEQLACARSSRSIRPSCWISCPKPRAPQPCSSSACRASSRKLKNEPSDITTFTLDNGIKDVKAMLEQGRKRGFELPLLQQTLACYEEARRNTSGSEEVSNVSAYWARRAKK